MREEVKGAISWALVAAFVTLTSSRLAGAAPAPSYSVEYTAPAECPPEQAFETALSSRVSGAVLVPATDASIAFRVTLSRSVTNFAGTLWIKLPGEPETRRDVGDPSCSDAASSLVMMAALVLDGYLRGTGPSADDVQASTSVASLEADASSGHVEPLAPVVASPAKAETASPPSPSASTQPDRPLPTAPSEPRAVTPSAFASMAWESAAAPSARGAPGKAPSMKSQ